MKVGSLLALSVPTGRILRVDVASGEFSVFLAEAGPIPDGIVVESGVVYWTTMGTPQVNGPTEAQRDYSRADGGVHAIGLDGTGQRDVVPRGSVTTGKQLATDGAGTLYWGDREGCRVSCACTDGSGQADLVVRTRGEGWLAECVGVAVDPAGGYLYWSQKGPAKGGRGRIFRAGLALPPGASPADRDDIELLWDGLPEPIDLHLDDGWLYWTDRGAEPDGNTLNRARVPAPGRRGGSSQILARGLLEAIGLVIDSAAGVAYASDLGGNIRAVPLPGRDVGPERTVLTLAGGITGIAAVRD